MPPPIPADLDLSDFLLSHLPLIEIRFLYRHKATLELYTTLAKLFTAPGKIDIDRLLQLLRDYRRSLLN